MNLRTNAWMTKAIMMLVTTFVASQSIFASDAPAKPDVPAVSSTEDASAGTRRALILCGLSGDADHHKLFAESVVKLQDGLCRNLGFDAENIVVLFGEEAWEADQELIKSARRSTREELEKACKEVRGTLKAEDGLWVIVLGHSHYDSRNSWLNLPGPDINELEFAKLFDGVTAREQVFLITTPTSGLYINPLSAKGRVVISATEEGWETNETEFPHELARVLASPSVTNEFDIDADGVITLFDLYVNLARDLAQSYLDRELLATEHPLLDDNGDHRGTEVQIDFLTVEQGGRPKRGKSAGAAPKPNSEGSTAKSIRLAFPLKEAKPDEANPPPANESL
jgi:hypothetical protein